MLHDHHAMFAPDVRVRAAKPPKHLEVLDGVARELMPAVWGLGLRCSVLRVPADLTPRERRFVEAVDRDVERIARVLASVHDLIVAETEGQLPLDPHRSHVAAICDDALDQLHGAGIRDPISCEGEGDGEGVWDAERLSQAVSYLLECALAAGPPEARVRLHWTGGPRNVVLTVERKTTPEEAQSVIAVDWGSTVAAGPENGVKTTVARRIVLQHGGTLGRFATSRAVAYVAVLPREAPADLE